LRGWTVGRLLIEAGDFGCGKNEMVAANFYAGHRDESKGDAGWFWDAGADIQRVCSVLFLPTHALA
jgi:hypothetical protein